MSRLYIFADEAGDFSFSRIGNASRYFILCTVAMEACDIANALLQLRRDLTLEGTILTDCFHCTTDAQAVRNRVYDVIRAHDFTVQATIMEKTKAQPHIRVSQPEFYKYGWYYHFKHGARKQFAHRPELLVTAAALGNGKQKAAFSSAVKDVMRQTVRGPVTTSFTPAAADPCLQVADYCAWAIQRKWERGDARSYDLIKDRITYEYDLWEKGTIHHY